MSNSVETVYKCKLCGEQVDINLPMEEPHYSTEDPMRFFMQHPEIATPLIHKCNKHGKQGVLEFAGIRQP